MNRERAKVEREVGAILDAMPAGRLSDRPRRQVAGIIVRGLLDAGWELVAPEVPQPSQVIQAPDGGLLLAWGPPGAPQAPVEARQALDGAILRARALAGVAPLDLDQARGTPTA